MISRFFALESKITYIERVEKEWTCQTETETEKYNWDRTRDTDQVTNRIAYCRLNLCNCVLKQNVFFLRSILGKNYHLQDLRMEKKKTCSSFCFAAQWVTTLTQSVTTNGVITATWARVRSYMIQERRAMVILSSRPESDTFSVMKMTRFLDLICYVCVRVVSSGQNFAGEIHHSISLQSTVWYSHLKVPWKWRCDALDLVGHVWQRLKYEDWRPVGTYEFGASIDFPHGSGIAYCQWHTVSDIGCFYDAKHQHRKQNDDCFENTMITTGK